VDAVVLVDLTLFASSKRLLDNERETGRNVADSHMKMLFSSRGVNDSFVGHSLDIISYITSPEKQSSNTDLHAFRKRHGSFVPSASFGGTTGHRKSVWVGHKVCIIFQLNNVYPD
jgi:hypothetical protein